jgi:TolB-like protein
MAFQVQLLGRFALRSAAGDEIAVPSKKGQALIAVLALADGAPVPREQLTGLLWSERGEAQARGSLRQALTALRRVFEGVAPSPLVIEADHVALDLDTAEVDAVAASALAAGESADDLERAASLYRGEFLAGLQVRDPAFDDWLAAERRRVQRQLLEVLGRLLATHEAEGQEKQAIVTAERLLTQDPLSESTHRALMRLYAQTGERTQALGQYRLCREALERELGVAPDPATEALYREIRAGETPSAQTPAETAETGQAAAPTSAPLPLPDKPSIAVLPFANLSDDPEQDYFADGITDEIITELIRFRSLFVIGSTSSFHYKGQSPKVQDVGRELGVAYVLEGSVRKAGNRVRVTAQLVEAATGQHIWAERYDRELEDIFAVQDEVTGKIVSTLAGHLEEMDRRRVIDKKTEDLAAYDYLLLGEQGLRQLSMDGILEARQMFQRAIDLEPGSARAVTGLARSYLDELWSDWTTATEAVAEQAFVLAKKAVALDELDGRARINLATAYLLVKSNFELAEIQFDKALELNPNDSDGYCHKGWCHALAGQGEQAIVCTDRAIRLSPFDIYACREAQFTVAYTAGRYEEALTALGSIPDPGPDVSALLAACYAQQGRDAEAQR